MNVNFEAHPGTDFTEPGKSPIVTGKGTYEEWWLAPNKWRREVTLGSYHAVEVLDGVRKFQATDLLPSGMPVRLTDRTGLTTGWEQQLNLGGKAVPGHLVVQALGRDLVTADIAVSTASALDQNLFILPGDKADACMTLRPFDQWELSIWPAISQRTPKTPNDPLPLYPPGVEVVAIAVVDRKGIPREPEASGFSRRLPG